VVARTRDRVPTRAGTVDCVGVPAAFS